jgi:hypothetical protein
MPLRHPSKEKEMGFYAPSLFLLLLAVDFADRQQSSL